MQTRSEQLIAHELGATSAAVVSSVFVDAWHLSQDEEDPGIYEQSRVLKERYAGLASRISQHATMASIETDGRLIMTTPRQARKIALRQTVRTFDLLTEARWDRYDTQWRNSLHRRLGHTVLPDVGAVDVIADESLPQLEGYERAHYDVDAFADIFGNGVRNITLDALDSETNFFVERFRSNPHAADRVVDNLIGLPLAG